MNKHKLPAYTIMEMVIAMMIAAIVIGIAFTAFSIVSRAYSGYNQKNSKTAEALRLDKQLRRDIRHAETLLGNKDELLCTDSTHLISYAFRNDFVLRKEMVTDTFMVKNNELYFSFENESVSADMLADKEKSRVDHISFRLELEKETIPYQYNKIYSSANLLNRH